MEASSLSHEVLTSFKLLHDIQFGLKSLEPWVQPGGLDRSWLPLVLGLGVVGLAHLHRARLFLCKSVHELVRVLGSAQIRINRRSHRREQLRVYAAFNKVLDVSPLFNFQSRIKGYLLWEN